VVVRCPAVDLAARSALAFPWDASVAGEAFTLAYPLIVRVVLGPAAAARAWGFVPVYQTLGVIAARKRTAQHLSS
jgi:hypothetical protein